METQTNTGAQITPMLPHGPAWTGSRRENEWMDFAVDVAEHIEKYTVPQYGDLPDDQASGFSIEDIQTNMRRYINRVGRNARGEAEALRDCYKLAHYACMLASKIREGQS